MSIQDFYQKFKKSRYLNFIEECRTKAVEKGEIHHIYLRSFADGRVDEAFNVVTLSVPDHIKAHILLMLSFEDLGLNSNSISYQKAANAVNICCNVQWQKLSEEEKERLLQAVPELAKIRETAQQVASDRLHKINADRWLGDPMGMCHTSEAVKKSLQTRSIKFGNPAGATHNEETTRKRLLSSKKTHIQRYGSMTALMCTRESFQKSLETRRKKYGEDVCKPMHTVEAREKALNTLKAKGFQNCTEHMNTAAVRAKANETIKKRFGKVGGQLGTEKSKKRRVQVQNERRAIRMLIIRTEDFGCWYSSFPKGTFSNKLRSVSVYLKEKGKTLEDYRKVG